MRFQYKIYLITLISIIFLVLINEYNLFVLSAQNLPKQELITTADEASYFAPVRNYIEFCTWKDNQNGISSYFTRTPGYGFFFLISTLLGGSKAYFILKCIQIAFFGGSILLFSKVLNALNLNETIRLIGVSIYACLPCYSGFVYYTLSESILPFFLLWSIFSYQKANRENFFSWDMIVSNGFLIMIRPQLIIFPILFLIYSIIKKQRLAVSLLIAFIPFILWNIRTVSIADNWLGIHPIYSKTNNSVFRPPHQSMTELFRIWDYRGDVFHSSIATLSKDTSITSLNKVLCEIPRKYRLEVKPILHSFQLLRQQQKEIPFDSKIIDFLTGELNFISETNALKHKLINENRLDYYLITPSKSFKQLMFTSMMNLNIYQDQWSTNLGVICVKFLCFILIISGFCVSLSFLFIQVNQIIKLSAIGCVISIFYLVYFQRFNEERYIYPFLVLLLMNTLYLIQLCREKRSLSLKNREEISPRF